MGFDEYGETEHAFECLAKNCGRSLMVRWEAAKPYEHEEYGEVIRAPARCDAHHRHWVYEDKEDKSLMDYELAV